MSETTIKDHGEKEKRHREDSPSADAATEPSKRREIDSSLKVPVDAAATTSTEGIQSDTSLSGPNPVKVDGDVNAKSKHEKHTNIAQNANTDGAKKFGFAQAKGFASLAGAGSVFGSSTAGSSTFSSLFSKGGQDSGFSSLLNSAPSSSIFSQETAADAGDKDKTADDAADGDEDPETAPVVADDDQYVVVKGLEKTSVPTGEEGETCIHLIRAKLYAIDPRNTDAGWKERGVGNLRILQNSEKRTRLVMRADAVYRVILNLPLHPKYKLEDGGASMGEKTLRLFAMEDGLGTWLAIRVNSRKSAEELKAVIRQGMDDTPAAPEAVKEKDDEVERTESPIVEKVTGIVPHAEVTAGKATQEQSVDAVEATEIKNEKEIIKEKDQCIAPTSKAETD